MEVQGGALKELPFLVQHVYPCALLDAPEAAAGGGNSTKATLRVTRQNQAEEVQNRTKMVAEHVGFKTNQEDRLRVAKARKDLFKYASDRKHKALLRQVCRPRAYLNPLHVKLLLNFNI